MARGRIFILPITIRTVKRAANIEMWIFNAFFFRDYFHFGVFINLNLNFDENDLKKVFNFPII